MNQEENEVLQNIDRDGNNIGLVLPPFTLIDEVVAKKELVTYNKNNQTQYELPPSTFDGLSADGKILSYYLLSEGLANNIIKCYNYFIKTGIKEQLNGFQYKGDNCHIEITGINWNRPFRKNKDGSSEPLFPYHCRNEKTNYTATMGITFEVHDDSETNKKPPEVVKISNILEIPIMLGSRLDNIVEENMSDDYNRIKINECPLDQFGYFIINGKPKSLLLQEKLDMGITIRYNPKKQTKEVQLVSYLPKGTYRFLIYHTVKKLKSIAPPDIYYIDSGTGLREEDDDKEKPYLFIILAIYYYQLKHKYNQDLVFDEESIIDRISKYTKKEWVNIIKSQLISSFLYPNIVMSQMVVDEKNHDPELNPYLFLKENWKSLFNNYDPTFIKDNKDGYVNEKQVNIIDNFFNENILPHINNLKKDPIDIIETKIETICMCASKISEYTAGLVELDNINSWSLKRVEPPSRVIQMKFAKIWSDKVNNLLKNLKTLTFDQISKEFVTYFNKNSSSISDYVLKEIFGSSANKKDKLNSVTNLELTKGSIITALKHINQINTRASTRTQDRNVRKVDQSLIGFIGPADNPEKDNCGLVKAKAVTALISYINMLDKITVFIDINKDQIKGTDILMINHIYYGTCNGILLESMLKKARRNKIEPEIKRNVDLAGSKFSVVYDKNRQILNIITNVSRLFRPLLVVEKDENGRIYLPLEDKIKEIIGYKSNQDNDDNERDTIFNRKIFSRFDVIKYISNFDQMLQDGVVEYIDPYEQEYSAFIAQSIDDMKLKIKDYNYYLIQSIKSREKYYQILNNFKENENENDDVKISEYQNYKDKIDELEKQIEIERNKNKTIEIIKNITELNKELDIVKYKLNQVLTLRQELYDDLDENEEQLREAEKEYESYSIKYKIIQTKYNFTHCEVDPSALFAHASLPMPSLNMCQPNRITFNAKMTLQMVGFGNTQYRKRFDKTSIIAMYPSRPIFEPSINRLVGFDKAPSGSTIEIAIMTYSGYNQEDSIIFNKGSIDRGMFQYMKTFTISETCDPDETFGLPDINVSNYNKLHSINEYGFPTVGLYLNVGDYVIGKIKKTYDGKIIDVSQKISKGKEGIVDSIIYLDNKLKTVEVKIRSVRKPKIGDKFAIRYSQKGTIGMILPEEDIPYSYQYNPKLKRTDMYRPDLIFNPHGIPTRMTIGMLHEIISSIGGSLKARRIDASPFKKDQQIDLVKVLREYGFTTNGKKRFINPKTGEPMEGLTFSGLVYMTALKHQAQDKEQSRGKEGKRDPITRQPTKSKNGGEKGGASRMGKMEIDALIAVGLNSVRKEMWLESSDGCDLLVCKNKKCGKFVPYRQLDKNDLTCLACNNNQLAKVNIPFTFKHVMDIIGPTGVGFRIETSESEKMKDKFNQDEEEQVIEDDSEDELEELTEEEEEVGSDIE